MFDNVALAAIAARPPDCFEPGGWERKQPPPPRLRGQNTGQGCLFYGGYQSTFFFFFLLHFFFFFFFHLLITVPDSLFDVFLTTDEETFFRLRLVIAGDETALVFEKE